MRHEDLPYRKNVGIMLLSRSGLVFMGRRRADSGPEHVDKSHSWQMPQGGIDKEEDPYPAALRELREETNLKNGSRFVLKEQTPRSIFYLRKADTNPNSMNGGGCPCKTC